VTSAASRRKPGGSKSLTSGRQSSGKLSSNAFWQHARCDYKTEIPRVLQNPFLQRHSIWISAGDAWTVPDMNGLYCCSIKDPCLHAACMRRKCCRASGRPAIVRMVRIGRRPRAAIAPFHRMQTVFCCDLNPATGVGRRLRLTNGGYKDLLEAIKKLKAGQTTKEDTVQVARSIFNDGGCEDMFGASGTGPNPTLNPDSDHDPKTSLKPSL